MSVHYFSGGAEEVGKLAETMLRDSLKDPELRALVEQMLADERLTKAELYRLAFFQGVVCTVGALEQGRLFSVSPE